MKKSVSPQNAVDTGPIATGVRGNLFPFVQDLLRPQSKTPPLTPTDLPEIWRALTTQQDLLLYLARKVYGDAVCDELANSRLNILINGLRVELNALNCGTTSKVLQPKRVVDAEGNLSGAKTHISAYPPTLEWKDITAEAAHYLVLNCGVESLKVARSMVIQAMNVGRVVRTAHSLEKHDGDMDGERRLNAQEILDFAVAGGLTSCEDRDGVSKLSEQERKKRLLQFVEDLTFRVGPRKSGS